MTFEEELRAANQARNMATPRYEQDPSGKTEGAVKFDAGKAPIARGFLDCFPRAIEAVATVSQAGYEKYKKWAGWRDVENAEIRYRDALARHLLSDAVYDNGSGGTGCMHLAQVAWNALALLDLYLEQHPQAPLRVPLITTKRLAPLPESFKAREEQVDRIIGQDLPDPGQEPAPYPDPMRATWPCRCDRWCTPTALNRDLYHCRATKAASTGTEGR
jgi:Domain of unknown function (DUF5664)